MFDCIVYIATPMTGRDKLEQVKRAWTVRQTLTYCGLVGISPIIEEKVTPEPGPLINDDRERLHGFWKRDKDIIRRVAHVILIDGADSKSWGVEREYGLSRFCLWKPTILLVTSRKLTVGDFEDDYICTSPREAGEFIQKHFGTRWKRWKWRFRMVARTLPKWIYWQLLAWR